LIRNVIVLVHAFGYTKVKCLVGHDFGTVTAGLCALACPDFFSSLVLMSHSFKGPLALPFNTAYGASRPLKPVDMEAELAKLDRPRKHYMVLLHVTRRFRDEGPTSSLCEFLRGYFYLKNAGLTGNDLRPMKEWEASELTKISR
jgi:pimeloyl-ACP methyl ester carboxylesterase